MRDHEQDQHTMEQVPGDAVGRRVLCEGEQATVRYIGTVPPTSGECLALCVQELIVVYSPTLLEVDYIS